MIRTLLCTLLLLRAAAFAAAQPVFTLQKTWFPDQPVSKVSVGKDGNVWVVKGPGRGEIGVVSPGQPEQDLSALFSAVATSAFTDILGVDDGLCFVGTENDYLLRHVYASGAVTQLAEANGIGSPAVNSLAHMPSFSSSLFLGTGKGVYHSKDFAHFLPNYFGGQPLAYKPAMIRYASPLTLLVDIEAPNYRCVPGDRTLLSLSNYLFHEATYDSIPVQVNTAAAIHETGVYDARPSLYWGADAGFRINDIENCYKSEVVYLPGERVNKIAELIHFPADGYTADSRSGQIYVLIGTGNGLYCTNDRKQTSLMSLFPVPATAGLQINDIETDRCGTTVWLATNRGLYQLGVRVVPRAGSLKDALYPAGPVLLCNGDATQLTTANEKDYRIAWLKDGAVIPGESKSTLSVTQPGKYRAVLTNRCYGFTDTTRTTRVAADTVVSAWLNYAGRNVICAGQPVVLQTTHYVRHAFQWFRDGVPTGQGRPELVAGESGWYKVRVTNCNGYAALSDSVQLVVTAPPRPDVQYASTLCYGDSLRLGNAAGMVVKWYRDDGALWAFDNHQAIAVTTSGTYHVTYTNEAGCTSRSAPIDLAVPQPHDMQIHPSGNGICPGEALQLTASTNAPHVRWSNGAQTKTIQVRRPGTYSVRAWEKPGCESWASIQVPELALPTVALGPDTSVCPAKGTPVIFRLDLGKGRYFLNESPVFTSLVRIYKPGVYTLRLVDGNGCTAQDTLRVDEVCEPEPLLIPNVITPNGDGLNDYFVVEGLYAPCELVVYNRWGKVVYRNEAYHNTWNGEGANAGVYYYTLRSTDATRRLWKGWIHVLR